MINISIQCDRGHTGYKAWHYFLRSEDLSKSSKSKAEQPTTHIIIILVGRIGLCYQNYAHEGKASIIC